MLEYLYLELICRHVYRCHTCVVARGIPATTHVCGNSVRHLPHISAQRRLRGSLPSTPHRLWVATLTIHPTTPNRSTELLFVHHKRRLKHNHITLALITKRGGYIIAHLRKLEKAAMVAFMEMPMSANAKLNTRKLLGVLSSLTLRKATTVTAFRKKPSRP